MDCVKTAKAIVSWLIDKLEESKQKGFVVGVSGGVDSALVSTLCAMTQAPVACLILPIHQNAEHTNRGLEHTQKLHDTFENVSTRLVDLSVVSDTLKDTIGCFVQGLVEANMRSRLRMTTLYAFANNNKYLVAGTGNLIEDERLGFFSKFGDGAVDLSPIGNLTKTQVFELAAHLWIPESILKAKPTDGLWNDDSHSDEDQLGDTYTDLERAMALCDDLDIGTVEQYQDFVAKNLIKVPVENEKTILNYLRRHSANAHKMRMPPIGPEPIL